MHIPLCAYDQIRLCKACWLELTGLFYDFQVGATPDHLVSPGEMAVASTLGAKLDKGQGCTHLEGVSSHRVVPDFYYVTPWSGHLGNGLQCTLGSLLSGQLRRKWSLMGRVASLSLPDW